MLHRERRNAVAFVVHDAAPATWPECAALLRMLDELGAQPITILVVPHYHYRDPIAKDRRFVAALDARLAAGNSTGDSSYWTGLLYGLARTSPDARFLLYSNAEKPAGTT